MRTIFIDECKQGPDILSGHLVDDKDIHKLRKSFKEQLETRQHQFHFSKEKDGKRQQMFKFFASQNCLAILVVCNRESGKGLRETALIRMIEAAEKFGAERFIVNERRAGFPTRLHLSCFYSRFPMTTRPSPAAGV
jgi:hypothetical protein